MLRELGYGPTDRPSYYNLVLITDDGPDQVAERLAAMGLPPDSARYGYRPLHQQPLFAEYATRCPNAETLTASASQVPVHPGLPDATLEWVAARLAVLAHEGISS